ncbi:hypothetical protein M8811_23320 [Escherichia coli]|uniref:hypothetical protein n=1 Tax=Escherichia coli TaxID=562 RepID=UPI00207AF622|nr:hypothetical protein [Escherichia coli]MCN0132339.1 hypothetical protein [Escherichia coli]
MTQHDQKMTINLLINQSTLYRRVFHLAFTGQLPRYAMSRHADLVALVEQNRDQLADVHRSITGNGLLTIYTDPDFDLLLSGGWSCMKSQRRFDEVVDDFVTRLSELVGSN